jgi:hypothetical protein
VGFGNVMITVAATTERQTVNTGSDIAVGGALLVGLLVSHGLRNPTVGRATFPAMWATLTSAVVFSLLFPLIQQAKPAEVEGDSAPASNTPADDSK